MEFIDYYKTLGVDKKASSTELKKAFRKLARKNHPDLHPNDPEAKARFQRINEAYEVLGDPENRKKYDEYGEHWKHADEIKAQQAAQGNWQSGAQAGNFSDGDFSSFFESIFGQRQGGFSGGGGQPRFRGQDIQATLNLKLSEVRKAHKQTFDINNKKVRITIPAGVEDKQTIKLKGHGGPGINEGPPGDLYITFYVTNDLGFKRVGDKLYKTVDLDLVTAVLGGEVDLDTLYGKVKLQVKPGTQNGTKARLKGKGFPKYKKEDEIGDLIVDYNVKIPTSLTKHEKELFEQLRKEQQNVAA